MPWSADRLNNISTLDELKKALVVADDSPTGLRWAPDYLAKRVRPGAVAGGWETNLMQPTVHARGYPLYCRHAVWMLTHDQPIPVGMDVTFADGDPRNLSAANLDIVMKQNNLRRDSAGVDPLTRAARNKAIMPSGIAFRHLLHGGYVVDIHIRKHVCPLHITDTRLEALLVGFKAGMAFGYVTEGPLTGLDHDTAALVTRRALAIYKPLDRLTPSQEFVKRQFTTQLQAEMRAINDEAVSAKEAISARARTGDAAMRAVEQGVGGVETPTQAQE